MKQNLRLIPAIHELQKNKQFNTFIEKYSFSEELLTNLLRKAVNEIRQEILSTEEKATVDLENEIWHRLETKCERRKEFYLRKVINGTGTILHTNLGRARLSDKAIERVLEVAKGYSNLEFNNSTGKRGSRHDILESMLTELTGSEAAMVVNNNAAAVYLILKALAKEKEVIVSRGQLVEIGGSFRISSIMEESGAKLVEVGTTNKTHLYDYEHALNENTAMILKVHTSNFKTIGFTKTVGTNELVALKMIKEDVVIYEDLGSGVLVDLMGKGIGEEPVVKEVTAQGVDLVSFSGDKLLGGPQAGIIVGKKNYIDLLKKHQLARVLRVDKMSIAALEGTLMAYFTDEEKEIPTIRDILQPIEHIHQKTEYAKNELEKLLPAFSLQLCEDVSYIGGGTMPEVNLPTTILKITPPETISVNSVVERLRFGTPSVVVRQKDNRIIVDFRTITEEEVNEVCSALMHVLGEEL
ncbi:MULTISPECIES: L-seryl-tRNA(Sec) selenium transferase [Bacillus]|uniref:L-seryl-tRNA(Sec) selenium transferase n=1 Tax=Bacillus TaxID=1386 RepID=UPI000BB688B3|nr:MULTISPECIES: L-seryl-tRNA(Sec) selenium transferase [Bacillus]